MLGFGPFTSARDGSRSASCRCVLGESRKLVGGPAFGLFPSISESINTRPRCRRITLRTLPFHRFERARRTCAGGTLPCLCPPTPRSGTIVAQRPEKSRRASVQSWTPPARLFVLCNFGPISIVTCRARLSQLASSDQPREGAARRFEVLQVKREKRLAGGLLPAAWRPSRTTDCPALGKDRSTPSAGDGRPRAENQACR